MKRFFGWLILLSAFLILALSFHQPPMRLMPTPAIFQKSGSAIFAANPAFARETRMEIFYATNRLPIGPRTNRLYAVAPGRNLHLGIASLRIGEDSTTWNEIYELSTGTSEDRRPRLNLENLSELATVEDETDILANPDLATPGTRAWFKLIDAALERSADKDIIIYVHGANSTVERAAGQAAQLRHFTGRNSVVLLFAWPTAENFLRYPQDVVTAFGAAPKLAELVKLLAANTKARNIDILTYSAGGTVGSDGLALLGREAREPGARDIRLGEVYHAAPDADFRSFVDDFRDYAGLARRVTVAANLGDITLRLSQTVNRASRAGRPDMAELSPNQARFLLDATRNKRLELLKVRPYDIPNLSERSHSFWYNDPWVSSDVLITFLFSLPPAARGLTTETSADGKTLWTFPPDYLQRLPAVMARLRPASAETPPSG